MARIRRPKTINGSEYTFGGGSGGGGTVGGFVKIAKGNMNTNSADHDGFLSSGDTVSITLDAGTAIPNKDQYIYFDNAFDTSTGTFTYEFMNGDTALPAGMNWSENNDTEGSDLGYAGFNGTPSTEGTNSFKIKAFYNQGDTSEQVEITYTIKRFPAGTTPVWSSTDLPTQIIRNTAGDQVLAAGPTTTYADATYRLSNVSGFATGVVPTIDVATGQVVVTGVGDISQAASVHAFTVTADLGSEIGTFTQAFSGSVGYGDPYGSRYFGPANFSQNVNNSLAIPIGQTDNYHHPNKNTGALRRIWNVRQDTSPYMENDGYGCHGDDYHIPNSASYSANSGYQANGTMFIRPQNNDYMCSSNNHQYVKGYWEVPAGVTEIAAVVVGSGGPGSYTWAQDGGGGGGLAWLNGISVTPGEILQWCWGIGRYSESSNSSFGGGPSWIRRYSGGSNTHCLLYASGGGWTGFQNSSPNNQSTNLTGGETITGLTHWDIGNGYSGNNSRDAGGWGVRTDEGRAVSDGAGNTWHYGGGAGHATSGSREGGAAGGYRGNQQSSGNSDHGRRGGGGSGYEYSSTWGEGGGGGVGLDGQGAQGAHSNGGARSDVDAGSGYGGSQGNWTSYNFGSPNYYGGGGGGSGGTRGAYGENQFTGREERSGGQRVRVGGLHGGGGGGSGTSAGGGNGACGGVRIIWGVGADGTDRSFPYTYCSEKPSMKYNGEA